MLDKCPSEKEIISLVGKPLYNIWLSLTESIDAKYEMERLWNSGGKMWKYEYKYRRGGKTRAVSGKTASVFGAGKRCALSMQEKTVSVLWWYSGKRRGLNLRQAEMVIQKKRKKFMTKHRRIVTVNG